MAEEKQEQKKEKKWKEGKKSPNLGLSPEEHPETKKKLKKKTDDQVKKGEERLKKWKADQPRKYTAEDYNKAMEAQFRATEREDTSKDKRLYDAQLRLIAQGKGYVGTPRAQMDSTLMHRETQVKGESPYELTGMKKKREVKEEKKKLEKKFNPDKNRQTYKNNQELISKIQASVNTLKAEVDKMGDADKKGNYTPKAGVDSTKFSQKWAEYEQAESRLEEQQKFGAKLQAKFDQNMAETGVKELKF